ncbi:efflux RND transporter periplasmic adaptor subunit [Duganella callida]|uniref:Efflux RND transporter periplasmic adaptor subunit n=1 Tax=Duganella callida TaxID=2561932 RepID=A0A4Y9SKJ8_9BURK|nr:efflux RND transporter periplasmic adaptor subunit [Duganella callida]TFW27180.1 efflux RND transporter periplasmic adaptor subunit [Duganella callida]
MNKQNEQRDPLTAVKPKLKVWIGTTAALAISLALAGTALHQSSSKASEAPAPLPTVGVSVPLQRELESQLSFLGQYSAVDKVELRAQVGGTLTAINFKDGDIVHKGDVLFVIDPEPYQIKLSQAQAQLEAARARLGLAVRELARAETLKATDAGSTQNVEQRVAERLAAQAAVDGAQALVRDAQFDLNHTRIVAPFTGRIGDHQVSVGNLVAGSRGGASPTTLLTTLVSLDPIYLDFDMSEADHNTYARGAQGGSNKVAVSQGDATDYSRSGTLNFIDNALDRSSGTIHARAVVPNSDMKLTPGGFARVRIATTKPQPLLLVPDASVFPDQTEHYVLVVDQAGVVATKAVKVGEMRGGLRVIRAGLDAGDKVIVDGMPMAHPGAKVAMHAEAIKYADDESAPLQANVK